MTKRSLARWFFPFGAIRPVLFGVCRGMRYEVGPGIGATFCLGGEAFHHGFYQRVIRPGMHVWDLGANTGQSLMALGRLVGSSGSVHSFEPVRELAELAARQARLNGMDHVQVHCLAVSEQDGSLEFDFRAEVPTQGKLRQVEHDYLIADSKRRMVQAVSLDSFAMVNRLPRPDFIKIDVEGAGAAVFRGAWRTLGDHGPAVFMELHGPEEQQAVKELQTLGYALKNVRGRDPGSHDGMEQPDHLPASLKAGRRAHP